MNNDGRMDRGEGERLHAHRRRRFWSTLGWLALLGAVAGFLSGFFAAHEDAGGGSSTVGAIAAGAGIAAFLALAVYGSWRFFHNVDELELADNLWASMFALYAYALLFPIWSVTSRLDVIPEPNQWVIYAVTMGVGLITYLYRKLRNR